MDSQLDPSVVNLAKAIGTAESQGNYTAKGKSGEYGAYQMTPGFISGNAPKYLGMDYNPSQPLTPAQQDKLAYSVIKDWGTNDKLTPAQVASRWNSGNENAYLDPDHKGVNSFGAKYDTPAYVNKVSQNYTPPEQSSSQVATSSPQDASKPPSLTDWLTALSTKGLSWIMNNAKPIAATGIMAGSTAIGAGVGGMIEPLGGEIPGGIAGEMAGNAINKSLGLTGGGGENQPPVSGGTTTPSEDSSKSNEVLAGLLGNDMVQANSNTKKLADVQIQAMQGTQGNRQLLQDKNVQNGIQTNAMFGFTPDIGENGGIDYSRAMSKSQKTLSGLSRSMQDILRNEGTKGDFNAVNAEAKRIVRERLPEYEWKTADQHIDETLGAYQQNAKQDDNLGMFQKIKSETGHGRKWGILDTSAKKEAFKAISRASRKEIENKTKSKELYNAAMKMEQNLINGQSVMKRLNGKRAKANESLAKTILGTGGKVAAVYVGDKIGGPVGALIGYMVETNVAKSVDKKYGATIFESPAVRHAVKKLQETSPEAYEVLNQALNKEKISIEQLAERKGDDSLPEVLNKAQGLIKKTKKSPPLKLKLNKKTQ